jgi:hypothetical protein
VIGVVIGVRYNTGWLSKTEGRAWRELRIEAEGVRREEERDIGLFKGAMLLPWSLAW